MKQGKIYQVPELVKCHQETSADSTKSLEGPNVYFDSDPLLHTAVQLS